MRHCAPNTDRALKRGHPSPTAGSFSAAPAESSPPQADRSPATFPHALRGLGPCADSARKTHSPAPYGLTHHVTLSDRRLSGDGQRMGTTSAPPGPRRVGSQDPKVCQPPPGSRGPKLRGEPTVGGTARPVFVGRSAPWVRPEASDGEVRPRSLVRRMRWLTPTPASGRHGSRCSTCTWWRSASRSAIRDRWQACG